MGNSNSGPVAHVVILGGGYGGVTLAQQLDGVANIRVTIIERKDRFHHNIGSLRAAVQPGWENNIFVPYDRVFKRSKSPDTAPNSVAHGEVTDVLPNEKTVVYRNDNGSLQRVKYDYLVIATGSSYQLPAKAVSFKASESKAAFATLQSAVAAAKDVLVVGGGPVGVELAGEIKTEVAAANVTLIHAGARLANSDVNGPLPQKFSDRLKETSERVGVRVVLNERVNASPTAPPENVQVIGDGVWIGRHTLTGASGKVYNSDMTFFATGARPNSEVFRAHLGGALDAAGRVKVSPTLQVEGYPDIFAIGDVAASGGATTSVTATMFHAPLVAKNIRILARANAGKGMKQLAEYRAKPFGMFVTVGRKAGEGVLLPNTFMRSGVVSFLKGKDAFTGQYNKVLHYKIGQHD